MTPALTAKPALGLTGTPRAMLIGGLLVLGLAACDETVDRLLSGINTLGPDFVQAFGADRNDEPIDPDDATLVLTPAKEPFNP